MPEHCKAEHTRRAELGCVEDALKVDLRTLLIFRHKRSCLLFFSPVRAMAFMEHGLVKHNGIVSQMRLLECGFMLDNCSLPQVAGVEGWLQ